jgi:hypothetical protein
VVPVMFIAESPWMCRQPRVRRRQLLPSGRCGKLQSAGSILGMSGEARFLMYRVANYSVLPSAALPPSLRGHQHKLRLQPTRLPLHTFLKTQLFE